MPLSAETIFRRGNRCPIPENRMVAMMAVLAAMLLVDPSARRTIAVWPDQAAWGVMPMLPPPPW